ncbi:MAG: hypothetical protein PVH96_07720 [Gemmatimonadota bacterium]|jgi:uncharacterized repeat protein (TIGR01451 family)
MRRPPVFLAVLASVCLLVASCDGRDGPTGVEGSPIGIAINPALIPSAADDGALSINRIRASAVRISDDVVLGESIIDVSPTDATWTVDLDVTLPSSPTDVRVFVLLIHVEGSVETVEFSGLVGSLSLEAGDEVQVADIPIVRGPLANHFTTGVSITSAPGTLTVDESATLAATATTSASTAPTVFWTVLDSAVLSANGATVTGIGAGTGRVVASAGSFADTASVVVQPAQGLLDVQISKTVDVAQPLAGDTVSFTISATNAGPGQATNVTIVDPLPAEFQTPQHAASVGSVQNDTLWTIPTLDESQTATWTLTTVVAGGVAGTSATNRAYLASVSPGDGAPANDTAEVAVSFPLSAPPVVTISQPADSAVFDPGDPITFTAAANDPEQGDLSPSIAWTSNLDGDIGTGRSFTTSTLGAGLHTIIASVSDSDGGVGADTIHVTVALYTVPPTLNVPFGGTAALPITLSQPAPAGGVVLSVSSDAPTITAPTQSTVSIAQGALSGNATLQGVLPGTANVTVGNPQYGAAVTVASVTADLNILVSNISFASPFTETITIRFESQGTGIAAPAGGLPIALSSDDPTCVAVPPSVTIPAGQVTRTATLSYGGSATLQCQTYVRATSTNITPDSVLVTVSPAPTITVGDRTVGSGLQQVVTGSLGVTNHGGTTLTLTSSDPSTVLVSPNDTTPGTASIQIDVPDGSSGYNFYAQAPEGQTGSATLTATATGFNQGAGTTTVVQAGLVISGLSTNTTSLSPDDDFYASIGFVNGSSVSVQNVRAGGAPVTVTFTSSNVGSGVLTDGSITSDTVTATIPVGLYYTPTLVANGGVAFVATAAGTTTVTASAPGVVTQPNGSLDVNVTTPSLTTSARTVGSGLQVATSGNLGASAHGGVTVRVESADPATALVSPNDTTPGTAFIDVDVPDGTASFNYYVQGVEATTGTPAVTVTAPGFNSGQATMTVLQPGIILSGVNTSVTSLSPDDDFYASIGYPSGSTVSAQNIRAGGSPLTVTLSTSDGGVVRITDGVNSGDTLTATIPVGLYYSPTTVVGGGVAAEPVAAGTATITATAPGFITQPAGSQDVAVTAPSISLTTRTVGAGLQTPASGNLGASAHGGVTLRLESSSSQDLLLSPDQNTPGSAFIDLDIPDGQSSFSYYVQGVEGAVNAVTVTGTAPGFNTAQADMSVVQPGVILSGVATSLTTLSPDDPFYASVGIPSGNGVSVQNVRAGGSPLTATFVTDDQTVGILTDGVVSNDTVTAEIPVGFYYSPTSVANGGVAHNPISSGTANLTVSIPGFVTQPAGAAVVTVTTPMITLNPRTVGAGLQVSASGNLGASQHGGVTLTLTSSDPSTFLLSPDASTPGTASIDIDIGDGLSSFSYFVQGVEDITGDATITATADGFLNGTTTTTVVQPRITLISLPSSISAGAVNNDFYAIVGPPSGNSVSAQNVRAGGSAITVTATSSNVAAAEVATQSASGASVTAQILPGVYYTPTSFAAGGFTLDPIAEGSVTVQVTAPGFVTQPDGTWPVVVTP